MAWIIDLDNKLTKSYGDKNVENFKTFSRTKYQEILSLKVKLNVSPIEHVELVDL